VGFLFDNQKKKKIVIIDKSNMNKNLIKTINNKLTQLANETENAINIK